MKDRKKSPSPIVRRGGSWGRNAAITGVSLSVGAAVAAVSVSAHFARRVLTPEAQQESKVSVVELEPDTSTVWLSGPQVELDGRYSFIFDDGLGHAKLGPVAASRYVGSELMVARGVVAVDRGQLRVGSTGRITGWWYVDPGELGLDFEQVEVPLEGGFSWGWRVNPLATASPRDHWAIHIHGRGALPEETLRGLMPFAQAGISSLVLAYRNDPGAPRGRRGRYGLGVAESRDVDAAIAWAREQGARRVTLVGYSMGGTAVVYSATRGPLRRHVESIVLDSPALDWPGILLHQARLLRVPGWVARLGALLLDRGVVLGAIPGRRGTPVSELVPSFLSDRLNVPTLIHAGPEDTFVPWAGSVELARLLPSLVTLRESHGEHVKSWNTDPEGWERATFDFLHLHHAVAVP